MRLLTLALDTRSARVCGLRRHGERQRTRGGVNDGLLKMSGDHQRFRRV